MQSLHDVHAALNSIQQYVSKLIVEGECVPELENTLVSRIRVGKESKDVLEACHSYWRDYVSALHAELQNGERKREEGDGSDIVDPQLLGNFLTRSLAAENSIEIKGIRAASVGNSKATFILQLSPNKVLPDEVVLRMDQSFNFLGTKVSDEYPVLEVLYRNGVPTPKPLLLETTGGVLGKPFMLCSKEEGVVIGSIYDPPPRNDRILASIAGSLAKIHTVPVNQLASVNGLLNEENNICNEIDRYQSIWEGLGVVNPLLDTAFSWLNSHVQDAHGNHSIVHNDYNYHNILIDDSRVSAVLDWEMTYLGNPAADLAYFHYGAERGAGFAYFLKSYEAAGGVLPKSKEMDFYIIWAHTRFAVMIYQMIDGVKRGEIKGLRFLKSCVHTFPKPMLSMAEKLSELL
ncbi:MAG: phosphotransferase family protein [Porticoccaceae bacterium]